MGTVKRSRRDPTHEDAEGDVDVYEREVETGEDGTARTMFRYDREFDEEPRILVSSSAGIAEWSGRGTSQVSVSVRDAPADANVVVTVLANGPR